MKNAKRIMCLLMALLLIAVTAGCGEETVTAKKKKRVVVIKRDDSSEVSSSEEEDTSEEEEYTEDEDEYYVRRELAEKTADDGEYVEVFTPEYTVEATSWSGPAGYVIVYPKNSFQLKVIAKSLKEYFSKYAGVELTVTDDSAAETEKEILVGDTNRRKSSLSDSQFAVKLYGQKLCFESGNFNGAVKAAKWFMTLTYTAGKVNALSGSYDFESTKTRSDGVYSFVWGDEFDGTELDGSNWELTTHMGNYGYTEMLLSKDPKVIHVADGRLKLSAQRWFNPDDPTTEYAVSYTVEAKKHANFQYGYMEMRARYPIKSGAWPSWWLSGNCTDGVTAQYYTNGDIYPSDFKAEVDILEYTGIIPNLHKWYYNGDHSQYNYSKDADGNSRIATSYDLEEEDSYIYHVFGYEWTPEKMTIYCDGNAFMTFDLSESFDSNDDMSDFQNPLFVRFNNHLLPDNIPTNKASLPCEYYIDYVRLYQRSDIGGLWLAE